MQTQVLVPLEEYLTADYEVDCDFVDGMIEERNVGTKKHAKLQTSIAAYFGSNFDRLHVHPLVEQRMRLRPRLYRVPDVCLFAGSEPDEEVISVPPHVVIEILSPDDRMHRVERKIKDFIDWGVRALWLIDPEDRTARIYTSSGRIEAKNLHLRLDDPLIELPLAEVFALIDARK